MAKTTEASGTGATKGSTESNPYEAIVIGTGFGGAVTACRLVEAGFDVCVLERGRVYEKDDFPKYPTEDLFANPDKHDDVIPPAPDFSRWLWRWDRGIYDVRDLGGAVSVQAAGYGGGSLIYANVHLRPPREVFDGWPEEYRNGRLDPYFDLAAYMLNVSTVPQRLLKTFQLRRAVKELHGGDEQSWFLTPLAVNFEDDITDLDGQKRNACDMRGRCCLGCNHQAKNTLDLNYLRRAEQGNAEIHTLAEVTTIEQASSELFAVTYKDLVVGRTEAGVRRDIERTVFGKYVFLCAGALNTTELLLKNPSLLGRQQGEHPNSTPLGSHYFPNTDSLAAVFECDQPHEPDYGPTITSAVLHRSPASGEFRYSVDFIGGTLGANEAEPAAGTAVRGKNTEAVKLTHDPILDWGDWRDGNAAGTFVFSDRIDLKQGEQLLIGRHGRATVRSNLVEQTHWFLVQDGGYPSDVEPLVGIFRSPFWMRRNRFIESDAKLHGPVAPPRRSARRHLRLAAFTDALRGTGTRAGVSPDGLLSRSFSGNPVAPGDADLTTFFPAWFVKAAGRERDAALDRVSAFALPMLGRLLDELSASVGKTIDGDILRRFNVTGFDEDDARKDVLIRGMLRQGLQVLAGSEAELATKVARLLLNPVPGTPSELLGLFGELLLWLLAYKVDHGHTAIILTMGRDMFRGRLSLDGPDENKQKKSKRKIKIDERRLIATLAGPLVDTSSIVQERVLREIAKTGWNGELRTNPTWASLGRRVTVHSQGGCPMGTDPNTSVTKPSGELHQCDRLYVMDAAAFPASVGVNPSATILAVAEHKIEQFIREHPSSTKWAVPKDAPEVLAWATPSRKKSLDPLNNDVRASDRVFEDKVISLTFREEMSGQFNAIDTTSAVDDLDTDVDPEKNQQTLASFGQAEDEGRHLIRVTLDATVADLARLISTDKCVKPAEIKVTGTVEIGPDKDGRYQEFTVKKNSFIQMFARPRKDAAPVRRFFNYRIWFDDTNSVEWLIEGRKVLRDDLGQDMWQDVSTLYFEMSTGGEPKFRGILRLSFNDFLQKQLKSMTIAGTPDPTRQMWALLAFYRYFARELLRVYVGRADEIVKIFSSAITGINV